MNLTDLVTKQKEHKISETRRVEPKEDKGQGSIEEARKVIDEYLQVDATKRPTAKTSCSDAKYYGKWSGWSPTSPISSWEFGNTSI